jgi:Tol biopolymer transport system component
LESGEQWSLSADCDRNHPAIAPDIGNLLFSSDCEGGGFDLWQHPLRDGKPFGKPRRITDQPGNTSHPSYSPDGKWVAYYQIIGATRDIWILPGQGGQPIQFTSHPASDIQPAWSPDGSLLAFASQRDPTSEGSRAGWQIWMAQVADGRRVGPFKRLTYGEVSALAPAFSPDGKEIAFVGRRGPDVDVWVVSVESAKEPRRITSGVDLGCLRWHADTIVASGFWDANRVGLKRIHPIDGTIESFTPEIVFGFGQFDYNFDISTDGRLLCHQLQKRRGNIWVLEAESGSF